MLVVIWPRHQKCNCLVQFIRSFHLKIAFFAIFGTNIFGCLTFSAFLILVCIRLPVAYPTSLVGILPPCHTHPLECCPGTGNRSEGIPGTHSPSETQIHLFRSTLALLHQKHTHADQLMCIFKAQRQTWVTSGCNRQAEPLPTQRTANLRQRQQRSTIRLSFWWAFNVSDNTGQISNKEQRWSERNIHRQSSVIQHTGKHTSWMTFWQGCVCPFSTIGFVCLIENKLNHFRIFF